MTANTLTRRVAKIISNYAGRGLSLERIAEQVPDATREQIRGAVKNLMRTGVIMRTGPALYVSLAPNGSMGTTDCSLNTVASTTPLRATETRHPAGLSIQRGSSADTDTWRGINWSFSTCRPGCLDHEAVPSRRGDQRIPYGTPMRLSPT